MIEYLHILIKIPLKVVIYCLIEKNPDSKVHMAHMGPIWFLSAPGEPHVGPMNLALREVITGSFDGSAHTGNKPSSNPMMIQLTRLRLVNFFSKYSFIF